jgi:hypothetical protein
MIRHKLFSKGERIHALVSNSRHSHIVFPVLGVIHDVKFDEDMPRYQIRITKFYDNIDFLKRYLFGMKFSKDFGNKKTTFGLSRKNYKSMKDFQDHIDSKWESYMISVDSVMCVKTKSEVIQLNNIQDFLIERNFKDIYELSSRSVYSGGSYYYQSKGVYSAHLKKFLGEREPKMDKYYDKLLYRPQSDDLDDIEL